MLEGVDRVRAGTAPKIKQEPDAGSYEGWCRKEDAEIDWNKPAGEIYNLIRGCNPQPGAWTTCNGNVVQIFDSALIAETGATPGEITALSEQGMTVAASDGRILIKRVRSQGGKKISASEFAAQNNLNAGARLG